MVYDHISCVQSYKHESRSPPWRTTTRPPVADTHTPQDLCQDLKHFRQDLSILCISTHNLLRYKTRIISLDIGHSHVEASAQECEYRFQPLNGCTRRAPLYPYSSFVICLTVQADFKVISASDTRKQCHYVVNTKSSPDSRMRLLKRKYTVAVSLPTLLLIWICLFYDWVARLWSDKIWR